MSNVHVLFLNWPHPYFCIFVFSFSRLWFMRDNLPSWSIYVHSPTEFHEIQTGYPGEFLLIPSWSCNDIIRLDTWCQERSFHSSVSRRMFPIRHWFNPVRRTIVITREASGLYCKLGELYKPLLICSISFYSRLSKNMHHDVENLSILKCSKLCCLASKQKKKNIVPNNFWILFRKYFETLEFIFDEISGNTPA